MSPKLALDSLDVYSTDAERVSHIIKRVLKFSDTEEKLFWCFDSYREKTPTKDKAQWDRCFGHFLNREKGRVHIAQDFAARLRGRLKADVEEFRRQHKVEGVIADTKAGRSASLDASDKIEDFIQEIYAASKLDVCVAFVNAVQAGHEEAVFLKHILDNLWMYNDRIRAVVDDLSGDTSLMGRMSQRRATEFARYLESRAKWLNLEENQAMLKSSLDAPAPTAKERRKARKMENRERRKGMPKEKQGGGEDDGAEM